MVEVPIYPFDCDDFANNGMGFLRPVRCEVRERANAVYELEMELPFDAEGRFLRARPGCVIKVNTPVCEAPAVLQTPGAPVRIWRVRKGASVYLRSRPTKKSKALTILSRQAKVIQLAEIDAAGWMRVETVSGGQVGYTASRYYELAETLSAAGASAEQAVSIVAAREQLFRIYRVEWDAAAGLATVWALHICYDLRARAVLPPLTIANLSASDAANALFSALDAQTPFHLTCGAFSGRVTGDFGGRSAMDALMNEKDGLIAQLGGRLIRDNFEMYLLPVAERDRGVTIGRGRNALQLRLTLDDADQATRIVPCGRRADGSKLYPDERYLDSPAAELYGTRARCVEYDVRVGGDADGETTFKTEALAKAALLMRAQRQFDAGGDRPARSIEATFLPGDVAPVGVVDLFDTVTVSDDRLGIDEKCLVVGYTWNVLGERFEALELEGGTIDE